jgi:Fe-S-cluster containining protein
MASDASRSRPRSRGKERKARERRPASKDRPDAVPRAKLRAARRLPVLAQPAIPCLSCALCCSYVAVEIDGPAKLKGATEILWYLYHPGVSVYVDEGEWMVQFETRCQHLLPDRRCGIYETRPPICREYDEVGCEVNADVVGQALYTPREYLAYLAQHHKRIHSLIKRRFLPSEESLDGRALTRARLEPFRPRYEALRARRARKSR